MAKIRYKRIPEPALLDLRDEDLKILSSALEEYKKLVDKDRVRLTPYQLETLHVLHSQVNTILLGEDSVEDTGGEVER